MATLPDVFLFTSAAELGMSVLTARKAHGLTQEALATKARVGRRFIRELERGKDTVRVGKAMAVLRALGLISIIISDEAEAILRG